MKQGRVRSEIRSENSKTKAEAFHGEKTKRVGEKPDGVSRYAVVKAAEGVTIAMGFQSVRMDIGVELPVKLKSEKSLRIGMAKAYEFLDDEMVKRSRDLDKLVRDLVKKYR